VATASGAHCLAGLGGAASLVAGTRLLRRDLEPRDLATVDGFRNPKAKHRLDGAKTLVN